MQARFTRHPLVAPMCAAALAAAVWVGCFRDVNRLAALVVAPAEAQLFGRRGFNALPATPERLLHNFYFARAIYSGGYWGPSWATDYPKADQQFIAVLRRLTAIDAFPRDHAVRLDDPNLRRFPFIYAVEVGGMSLRESEIEGLRNYLLAGGFLVVDDFWGTYEWRQFESQIRRVLPDHEIVELPKDHPIFSTVYQVGEVIQVPNVGQGEAGGPTHEQDGYVPHLFGIFDDQERLMVVINWNTDLGDAWEWAERAAYPLKYSTYAYQMGANFIVYAMTR